MQPKGGCVTVSGCPSSISGSSLPNWKRSEFLQLKQELTGGSQQAETQEQSAGETQSKV